MCATATAWSAAPSRSAARSAHVPPQAGRSAMVRRGQIPVGPSERAPPAGSVRPSRSGPWAGRAYAARRASAPARTLREAGRRARRSFDEARPHFRKYPREILKPHGLFKRPDHRQPKRFAEPEGGLKDAAVEAADDQHRCAAVSLGEEAEQLDAVHSGHAEVERDCIGPLRLDGLAESAVIAGQDWDETAFLGHLGDEIGQCRFIVDNEQPRLAHSNVPYVQSRFALCGKRLKPLFNRTAVKMGQNWFALRIAGMFSSIIRRKSGPDFSNEQAAFESTTFSLTTVVPRPAERRFDERLIPLLKIAKMTSNSG